MHTNPYFYTGPIINQKFFMGHRSLKSQVVYALENTEGRVFCITGGASMGKSTFLHQVEQSLSSCLPVFVDIAQISLLSAESVFNDLINAMTDCIKGCGCFPTVEGECSISQSKRENHQKQSAEEYFIELVRDFEIKGSPLHFALIADNADLLADSPWNKDFFNYFQSLITNKDLKHYLSALCAFMPENHRKFPLCSSVFTLTPFNKATVQEMIDKGFTHSDEELATQVFENTRGHPLLVQYVLHELYGENNVKSSNIHSLVQKCPISVSF